MSLKNQNLTSKLIKALNEDSMDLANESFTELVDSKLQKIYDSKVINSANKIWDVNEDQELFSYELSEALKFVLRELQSFHVKHLKTLVSEASKRYGTSITEINQALSEAVEGADLSEDKIKWDTVSESFLNSLNSIILEGNSQVIGFQNKSARKVEVYEASQLAKVYTHLTKNQKIRMVENMIKSKQDFDKVLVFAETLTEGYTAHLNNGDRTRHYDDGEKLHTELETKHEFRHVHGAAVFKDGQKIGHYDARVGGLVSSVTDLGKSHTTFHPDKVAEINKWKEQKPSNSPVRPPLRKENVDWQGDEHSEDDYIHRAAKRHPAHKILLNHGFKHISSGHEEADYVKPGHYITVNHRDSNFHHYTENTHPVKADQSDAYVHKKFGKTTELDSHLKSIREGLNESRQGAKTIHSVLTKYGYKHDKNFPTRPQDKVYTHKSLEHETVVSPDGFWTHHGNMEEGFPVESHTEHGTGYKSLEKHLSSIHGIKENINESDDPISDRTKTEIHGLLNRSGFKLDPIASKISKNGLVYKNNKGTPIIIGKLDTIESIKSHLASYPKEQ